MTLVLITFICAGGQAVCDADSDWFYLPERMEPADTGDGSASTACPALVILSCTGATGADLDSLTFIADSLGMALATCHASRNRRNSRLNDKDIMKTAEKLLARYPVDASRVYIYGFSGQGVQAMMSLFEHPQTFQGAIAACAHAGALPYARWQELKSTGRSFYLISRSKDWNLEQNRYMHDLFRAAGIRDTLAILKGEHAPPSSKQVFDACKWLINH